MQRAAGRGVSKRSTGDLHSMRRPVDVEYAWTRDTNAEFRFDVVSTVLVTSSFFRNPRIMIRGCDVAFVYDPRNSLVSLRIETKTKVQREIDSQGTKILLTRLD